MFGYLSQDEYVEVVKELEPLAQRLDKFNADFTTPENYVIKIMNQYDKYKQFAPTLNAQTNIVIGDSIIHQLAVSLNEEIEDYSNMYFEYEIGLQVEGTLELLQKYAFFDSSDTNLLFNIGNNGPISRRELAEMVELYPQSNIYILDLISNQEWTISSSRNISKIAKKYDNVHLVPVRKLLEEERTLLLQDNLHYTDETIIDVKSLILDTIINKGE